MTYRSLLTTLFLGLLALATPLYAAILPVTNNADAGPTSLRARIDQALPGDTITFAVNGTIALNSTLYLTQNLTLLGPGAELLTLDGQSLARLFWVADDDTVFISGLTLAGGHAVNDTSQRQGGGAIINQGYLVIKDCILKDNIAKNGGAIENDGFAGAATLALSGCTFFNNQAIETIDTVFNTPFAGGAIYSNGAGNGYSLITAINCTFSGNYAEKTGGAFFSEGDISGGTSFTATHCTFAFNASKGTAGIIDEQFSSIILRNCIVAQNDGVLSAPDIQGAILTDGNNLIGKPGAAIYTPAPGDIVNTNAGLASLAYNGGAVPTHALACESPAIDAANPAFAPAKDQRGQARIGAPDIGALERYAAVDVVVTNVFSKGKGSLRQAIFLACNGDTLDMQNLAGVVSLDATIEIDKSLTIIGNSAAALEFSGNDSVRLFDILPGNHLEMSWMTFRNGGPSLYGGGAFRNKGSLVLSHCTLRRNKAVSGGAIANYGEGDSASLVLTNCTLSGNEATVLDGGAIDNRAITHPATASLLHVTLANNQALNKGGGIYNEAGGNIRMRNTLIATNRCESGPDIFGTISSLGNNLLGDNRQAQLNGGTADKINMDPLLVYLGTYGGPTLTHRLSVNSPAIDAGNADNIPATDQRGESRTFNGLPDIGAYEYDPATQIESVENLSALRLWPNPNNGSFLLESQSLTGRSAAVSVFSLTGQKVYSQQTEFAPARWEIQLPSVPTGIYLLAVESAEGRASIRFVVE
ncbi:MAG: choice-of-anchor Q domain-containing protein [Bacteroidia bacterium]|nr:choice-of-anchor Q domain-containing protein [Bacteroidia bacterium]